MHARMLRRLRKGQAPTAFLRPLILEPETWAGSSGV
jgi:hypothetical protein